MDDRARFFGIFGEHRTRSNDNASLRLRDANLVVDLKARFSGLAAVDNRTRDSGWMVDFSPLRADDLTERTMFDATLTSAAHGTRRMSFAISRAWVQMGDGAMESSVRDDVRNLQEALGNAYRRVVLLEPQGTVDDPAAPKRVSP